MEVVTKKDRPSSRGRTWRLMQAVWNCRKSYYLGMVSRYSGFGVALAALSGSSPDLSDQDSWAGEGLAWCLRALHVIT